MKWLNRERLTVYPKIFLALYACFGAVLIISAAVSGNGLTDFLGRPLGADFSHYWVASSLAKAGDPAAVYNFQEFLAAQEAFFKVKFPLPWLYPPTYLLLVLPLALLPYLPALAVWLVVTLGAYLAVVRRIAPHPLTPWLALAFPGTFQNFFHGQNGFMSAALLGGGLLLLNRSPLTGGFLLGLLSYKTHLWVLVPLALVAGRRWRALMAAVAAALAMVLASWLVLGQQVWIAYWHNISLPMKLLEEGFLPIDKMVTIFSALLQFGTGLATALVVQTVIMIAVGGAIFRLWHRETAFAVQASGLVLGILLFTPYCFSYDLMLLALPLAWLGWEGYNKKWLPGEQLFLALGWTMPFIAIIGGQLKVQLAPLILVALFLLVWRRSRITAAAIWKPTKPY